jgi:hypothetical protein
VKDLVGTVMKCDADGQRGVVNRRPTEPQHPDEIRQHGPQANDGQLLFCDGWVLLGKVASSKRGVAEKIHRRLARAKDAGRTSSHAPRGRFKLLAVRTPEGASSRSPTGRQRCYILVYAQFFG